MKIKRKPKATPIGHLGIELASGVDILPGELLPADITPMTKKASLHPGSMASPTYFNDFFQAARYDIDMIDSIVTSSDSFLTTSFNNGATLLAGAKSSIKSLLGKAASAQLYNKRSMQDKLVERYDFTDSSEISSGSMTLSVKEGALTFPVSKIETIKTSASIGQNSNGRVGNSRDPSRGRNRNLSSITDSSPTTWFEYEGITPTQDTLRLDVLLTLAAEEIVNRLSIDVANLGTRYMPKIVDVQVLTSAGWRTIADEVIEGIGNDSLIGSMYRLTGASQFTFEPKKCSAVKVILEQTEHYLTTTGTTNIGIALRDITVERVSFASEGTFTLKDVTFEKPIIALALSGELAPYKEGDLSLSLNINTDTNEKVESATIMELKGGAEIFNFTSPVSRVSVSGIASKASSTFTETRRTLGNTILHVSRDVPLQGAETLLEAIPVSYFNAAITGIGGTGEFGRLQLGETSEEESAKEQFNVFVDVEDIDVYAGRDKLIKDTDYIAIPGVESRIELLKKFERRTRLSVSAPPQRNGRLIDEGDGYYSIKLKTPGAGGREDFRLYELTSNKIAPYTKTIRLPATKNKLQLDPSYGDIALAKLQGGGPILGSLVQFINGSKEFEGLDLAASIDALTNTLYYKINQAVHGTTASLFYTHDIKRKIIDYQPMGDSIKFKPSGLNNLEYTLVATNNQFVTIPRAKNIAVLKNGISGLDIDTNEVLMTEIEYINGITEFDSIQGSADGYYSFDYEEMTIHLPPIEKLVNQPAGVPGGKIIIESINIQIHQRVGIPLEASKDYTREGASFRLNSSAMRKIEERGLKGTASVSVSFDKRLSDASITEEMLDYYSPVIRSITLYGITLDKRLGILEG